jgi:hypothetical protein
LHEGLHKSDMKVLRLPNEIWFKILSNLDQKELLNASLVSKRFKELVLDPVLWTELDLILNLNILLWDEYQIMQGRQ